MSSLVKLSLAGLVIFSIGTAPAEEKADMFVGARAFIRSLVSACTRQGSPCTEVITFVRSFPSSPKAPLGINGNFDLQHRNETFQYNRNGTRKEPTAGNWMAR